mgnify:CR=1 FL=1
MAGAKPTAHTMSLTNARWPMPSAKNPNRQLFQQMLFTKVVPNCKKLGLLDANDGWLRHKFEELGVIQFEDLADTSDEYQAFALGETELGAAAG